MVNRKRSGRDTTQTIGLQLAMAFGQGTGSMLATSEALLAAFNQYVVAFERGAARWEQYELRAVNYARALGQVAASVAANNQRCVIDVKDVKRALIIMRRNTLRPLSICDLTPLIHRQPK